MLFLPSLLHGDNLDYFNKFQPGQFDAIITDPPYASGGLTRQSRAAAPSKKYQSGGAKKKYPDFENDSRDMRTHLMWTTEWMRQAYKVTRQGGFIIVFSDWRQLPLTSDALQLSGWTWKNIVTWDKTEACRPQKGLFRNQAEYVLIASKGSPSPLLPVYPSGVFRQYMRPLQKQHMTEKPVELMLHLMTVLPPASKILDPFAGAGSTLIAAHKAGHQATGIELSPEYFEIAKERIKCL